MLPVAHEVMECASLECERSSTLSARSAIANARALLDSALSESGSNIRVVAAQFQRLAANLDEVLELTSAIVDCVREDWVQALIPAVQGLESAARRFIAVRLDSIAAIDGVFADEAGMIDNLLSLTVEQRSIAREAKALGVLASIEVGRLGSDGRRFGYMAHQLNEFSAMVSSGVDRVGSEALARRVSLIDRRRILSRSIERRRGYFCILQSQLAGAISDVDKALAELRHISASFQQCVTTIAADISRIVEAVQMQDVTRQQTEHVDEALLRIDAELAGLDAAAEIGPRAAAILKVQSLQLESARSSTNGWIQQINQCLESILHVGAGDVIAIGGRIKQQERSLASQLEQIELLERDCGADDTEIEACFAGLASLMQTTRTHLEQSRLARDRMRLLNFNSMIEARHLGSQATSVLEITRNIGRISANWSALTGRSGDTLEAMFAASTQAEEAHRTRARAGIDELQSARKQSGSSLESLLHASAIANANGEKIDRSVSTLHGELTALHHSAERLIVTAAALAEARTEVEEACKVAAFSPRALTESDRDAIETECAVAYTSDLERRVLHAALRDEPLLSESSVSSEVELF